ncbi:Hemolysin, contains CBS domains [Flexibacter flexilis DSM 6793]|uniref:Hemolysin, contains CBS domains n=1 Tax=Flexibacter flexilis DSM 6793 TaxID=927664 RepID=A0A1I1KQX3_9BACT|nr:transporter associated domain-containing protein [Flexibacter flexilis]SFC62672.1 Hemolysin, contains CBS domains [Flexibacter flexilis DSM 6793]
MDSSNNNPYLFLAMWFDAAELLALSVVLLLAAWLMLALIWKAASAFLFTQPQTIEQLKNQPEPRLQQIALSWENPMQLLRNLSIISKAVWFMLLAFGVSAMFYLGFSPFWLLWLVPVFLAWEMSLMLSGRVQPIKNVGWLMPIVLFNEWVVRTWIAKRFADAHKVTEPENTVLLQTNVSDEQSRYKDMLQAIVAFDSVQVKNIMRARVRITAFDKTLTFHELLDRINKTGYSRVPIFNETIDSIEGILYVKDLIPHLNADEYFAWQQFLRPALFVPQNRKIDDLLRDFQQKQVHIAIVVDEYGGTCGVVTMQDIIEEVVGEINDEFDDAEKQYRQLNANTFLFEGQISLHDFSKVFHLQPNYFDAVRGESESLAGLLLELNKTLPKVGEKIAFQSFVFTIIGVSKRAIRRVRVQTNAAS